MAVLAVAFRASGAENFDQTLVSFKDYLTTLRPVELQELTAPSQVQLPDGSEYTLYGLVPVNGELRYKTLNMISKIANQHATVDAALAYANPDQVRGSDLPKVHSFEKLLQIIEHEADNHSTQS